MSQPLHAASHQQELEVAPELVPLLRLLLRAEGFALAFLECNVPVEAERVVAELRQALEARGRQSRILRLPEPEEDLLGRIRSQSPPPGTGEALFVLDFERSIPPRVDYPPALTRLNRARERFRELPFPLVLVLPRYALDQLSREAPDFWAWRSGVFEVRIEKGRFERLDAMQQAFGVYHSRREDHLEVLRALLADMEAQGNGSKAEKLAIHRRVAGILSSMARWSEAREHARQALKLAHEIGDETSTANTHLQLGFVAQGRGSYEEAQEDYRKALRIFEELSDRAGMATSYHQMGMVAHQLGSLEEALEWYRKALRDNEELGNRAGLAACHHQLGLVAHQLGSLEEALEWYRRALRDNEELGNRAGLAVSYHQLGRVASERGSYVEALEWYEKALRITEELGNHAGTAAALSQIGSLLTERGVPEDAVPWNLRSLSIRLEHELPEIGFDLHWLRRQREALGEERFRQLVTEHAGADGVEQVLGLLDKLAGESGT